MVDGRRLARTGLLSSMSRILVSKEVPFVAQGTLDLSSADNSGSRVVNLTTMLAITVDRRIKCSLGTSIILRMKYDGPITTSPVIQVLGINTLDDGTTEVGGFLINSSGSDEITLVAASTTDLTDATNYWSEVGKDQILDLQGSSDVLIVVKTAAVGGSVFELEYKIV